MASKKGSKGVDDLWRDIAKQMQEHPEVKISPDFEQCKSHYKLLMDKAKNEVNYRPFLYQSGQVTPYDRREQLLLDAALQEVTCTLRNVCYLQVRFPCQDEYNSSHSRTHSLVISFSEQVTRKEKTRRKRTGKSANTFSKLDWRW